MSLPVVEREITCRVGSTDCGRLLDVRAADRTELRCGIVDRVAIRAETRHWRRAWLLRLRLWRRSLLRRIPRLYGLLWVCLWLRRRRLWLGISRLWRWRAIRLLHGWLWLRICQWLRRRRGRRGVWGCSAATGQRRRIGASSWRGCWRGVSTWRTRRQLLAIDVRRGAITGGDCWLRRLATASEGEDQHGDDNQENDRPPQIPAITPIFGPGTGHSVAVALLCASVRYVVTPPNAG